MKNELNRPATPTGGLRMVYCPNCYLSTRASSERCLHCGKRLTERDEAPKVPPAAGRVKPAVSA